MVWSGLSLWLAYLVDHLVAWLLMLSLHNRNPVVLNAGDVYFRVLLCWGLFLPLAARCSLDRARSLTASNRCELERTGGSDRWIDWFGFAGGADVCLYSSAQDLNRMVARGDSGLVCDHLGAIHYSTGRLASNFPELLGWLTWGVYGMEWVGPLLLLWPILACLDTDHRCIFAHLTSFGSDPDDGVGFLPWICIAVLLSLFPKEIWDWLSSRNWLRQVPAENLILYYDQDCGFCRRMVGVLREFVLFGRAEIRPIQADPWHAFSIMKLPAVGLCSRENTTRLLVRDFGWYCSNHLGPHGQPVFV